MGLHHPTSSRSSRPRASAKTRSASSRPRRTSPNGCSTGGSRPIAPGWRWKRSDWAKLDIPAIDYQDAYYYAAPKAKPKLAVARRARSRNPAASTKSSASRSRSRRCSPGVEGARKVAVDAVFDSVSVATTFREELKKAGVIFLSITEAIREYPELVQKYLGTVVPQRDNYFACFNSAVFSDGTFVYIPEGVRCPMELSHLFPHQCREYRPVRAHPDRRRQGQLRLLSRRLHRADARREPAPRRGGRDLRARGCRDEIFDRPELVSRRRRRARAGSSISSPSARFVPGDRSKVVWTQVETGSAITWKYPSCILKGEGSVGEFYSVAVTNNRQQADTGTKMIHIGANTPLDDRRRRASARAGRTTPIAGWCACSRAPRMSATSPSAIQLLLGPRMRRAHRALYRGQEPDRDRSSMKRPRRRSARTSCSTR